jgi:Amt family ammonium transporter
VNPNGADGLLAGNPHQLLVQAIAVVCTIAFTAPVTAIVLSRLAALGSLRVPLADEVSGVDVSEHGEHAYDDGDAVLAGGGARIGDAVLLATPAPKQASAA